MISCVEFIPCYSELFSFLDENYTHKEVENFWKYLFEPDGKGIPLINYAKKDGLRGCFNYWKGTLTEEASNVTMRINEKNGWSSSHMYYCPSKGRLLELQKEIGLVPYYDYCGHCDYYRAALEKVGLTWIRNHLYVDKAECSRVIYDPKVFNGIMTMDENTETFEMRADQVEYFHPDFHSSMNMGIHYLGETHGEEKLKEFLTRYTKNVYVKTIEKMKDNPLGAIEEKIRETYSLEKADDILEIVNDGKSLRVKVEYCPAVKHLKKTGREVSKWFSYTTKGVMQTLADIANLKFDFISYDEQTGKAEYLFY